MMKRIGIVLLYIFSLILFVFGIYGFVLHIVKDSNIWFIASLGVVLMVYTQLLLKAFVNYYNTFLYDEIIFDDDDDEYFYIELDDSEDEVEKDEDEN